MTDTAQAGVAIASLLVVLKVIELVAPLVREAFARRKHSERPPPPSRADFDDTGRFALAALRSDVRELVSTHRNVTDAIGVRKGRPSLLEESLDRLVHISEEQTAILSRIEREHHELRRDLRQRMNGGTEATKM